MMQTPWQLPVQVEPVRLSNLFDSLSVNERQENKYDLGKLACCVTVLGFYRSRREGGRVSRDVKNINILL